MPRGRSCPGFGWAEGLLLAASIVLGLVLMEAALRLFSPVEMRVKGDDTINLPFFKSYRLTNSGNPKLDPVIVSSRNSLGFRGPEPPAGFADHLTVVAVGGSTTESFYVADGHTWPELVGALLAPSFRDLWINNAGLQGHSTFGHLVLMRRHVVPLAPKVALFLVGINDLTRDGLTPAEAELTATRRGPVFRWLMRHSELASLAWNVRRSLDASTLGIDPTGVDFAALPHLDLPPQRRAAALARHGSDRLSAYAGRLEELIAFARQAGIVPVLVTQPAVYGPAMDDATGADLGRMRVHDLDGLVAWEILERYNDATRGVAAATGADLIDLARLLPKSTAFFYDYIHLTREGSATTAAIVADGLCPMLAGRFSERVRRGCPSTGAAPRFR